MASSKGEVGFSLEPETVTTSKYSIIQNTPCLNSVPHMPEECDDVS